MIPPRYTSTILLLAVLLAVCAIVAKSS